MSELPIHAVLPELRQALSNHPSVVLQAEPGAGKTTVLPLALLNEPWLGNQKILLLEPRRIAARNAAQYMARQLGESVGETVGYRMRMDSRVSKRTRLEVITEGVLTRRLQHDPALEGVGLVIFDEFHERSVDADLGLALTLYGRELLRDKPDLKVLIMSATLNGDAVSALLGGAPVIDCPGQCYPVEIRYGEAYRYDQDLISRITQCIDQSLANDQGSILVFLPGQGEIRKCQLALQKCLGLRSDTLIVPLHGNLSLDEQQTAISPAPHGKRKIVLATSIAETSLTIEGIRIVIDSGLSRQPRFDPRTGLTRLHTLRLSQAASIQRAGRAGRLAPGVCYRLWSAEQQAQLSPYTAPEISQTDLSALALTLLDCGVRSDELALLTPPPEGAISQAMDLLCDLGAAMPQRDYWQITDHGRNMLELPLEPRLAHMLLSAREFGLEETACKLAALLNERSAVGADIDLELQLRTLNQQGEHHPSRTPSSRQKQTEHFRQLLRRLDITTSPVTQMGRHTQTETGLLLALAFPDRIAQQRSTNRLEYVLANGRSVHFRDHHALCQHPWLVIADCGGNQQMQDQVFAAAPLDPTAFDHQLAHLVKHRAVIAWDDSGTLKAENQWWLGQLLIRRQAMATLSNENRSRAAIDWIRREGLGVLPWSEGALQLRARIALLRAQALPGPDYWPDLSDISLLDTLEDWLTPYLNTITNQRQLLQLDMMEILQNRLDWEKQSNLKRLAPPNMEVPSGSHITIDYLQSPPVLAVKLQEMFGCTTTPTIAQGQVALCLHLLSPARKPVQVTQDLKSFWQSGYSEVKKELKGRYPRHPWPDDPLVAQATRLTKKQQAKMDTR